MGAKKETIKIKVKTEDKISWSELLQFELNSLKIGENRDVQKLKNAIINRGFNFPFYCWAGHQYVIDGSGRVTALKELEKEGHEIPDLPIVWIEADSFEQAKALVLQASSEHGKVTQESFAAFVEDIEIESLIDEISFPDIDFGEEEGTTLEPEGDPDEAPEVPEQPFTMLGDLYEIGPHRLLCGDSTSLASVDRLLQEEMVDMFLTDPPYNVAYEGKTKEALTIENDSMDHDSFYAFLLAIHKNMLSKAKQGAPIYVFHADSEGENFRRAFRESGFLLKQCLIWVKNSMVMGRQDYHWKHEPILYGWAPGAAHPWYSDRKQTTVLEFDRPNANREHPTMKPIAILEYLLHQSSKKKDTILDLFGGSGSTMVAAQQIGCKAYLMELSPKYCDVIVARMKKLWPDLPILHNGEPLDG